MKIEMVNTKDAYPVYIGRGILEQCGQYLRKQQFEGKVAIVSDDHVAPLYLDCLMTSVQSAGYESVSLVIAHGEASKSFGVLQDILQFMANEGMTRKDLVIALGGGVVGDVTGFAAACYMRGIAFVQVPTTLLAQVDSSVGGKTAINLLEGKNLAGAFIQPQFVVCDIDTLKTLPDDCYKEGMAEAIKTGILEGEELFSLFEEEDICEVWIEHVVERCIRYKARIVCEDPQEQGVRTLLNLGHTIAHAIEKQSNYEISHGQAVAIGIALVAKSSERNGKLSRDDLKRIIKVITDKGLPTTTSYDIKQLVKEVYFDKKRNGNTIRLVIPYGIGKAGVETYSLDQLEQFFCENA